MTSGISKNLKRGAITVTIKELVDIAKELLDYTENNMNGVDILTKFDLPIVNRFGTSDGWKFEHKKSSGNVRQ